MRTYYTLFAGTNKINRDEGNFITREDYKAGYALYAFDLTADLAESDHFILVKHGSVRLALRFSEPTPHTSALSHTLNSTTSWRLTAIEIYWWTLAFEYGRRANRTTAAQR